MTRSASHFCFVVFPPQSLLDVLESRVMKRTSISYCAMRDFAISAMANSTTQNDSQCESFFYLYSLIRCSRITSDEENVNKLLCDARLRVRIFWKQNFTVRSFGPVMAKSTKLLQFCFTQNFLIIITYTL